MIAQCPVPPPKWKLCQYQQKPLEKEKLNFSRCVLSHTKTKASLTYPVSHCSHKSALDKGQPGIQIHKKIQKVIAKTAVSPDSKAALQSALMNYLRKLNKRWSHALRVIINRTFMKTFSSVPELGHTRLAYQMWKIRQATFLSPSRCAIEKKKRRN